MPKIALASPTTPLGWSRDELRRIDAGSGLPIPEEAAAARAVIAPSQVRPA